MKRLRIGRRRAREVAKTPLELALAPALYEGRWSVPQHFNFASDVVEPLAADPKRRALTYLGRDGVIEPKTFIELSDGASRVAATLRERGVQPGDRVVLLLGTNAEWLELLLACLRVGAVATPCSPHLPVEALDARIASSGPALVVATHASERDLARLSFSPEVHYLTEEDRKKSSEPVDDTPAEDTAARDLALLVWSAGAATDPKPVAHTHGATFAARVAAEHWLDAGPGDAVWCTTDGAAAQTAWTVFGAWARRAEVLLQDGQLDPLDRLDLLHRLGTTILCQTPADYRALAELRELPRFRTSRIRRLVSFGDYLEPEVVQVFEEAWGLTIHDAYAQAETGVVIANGAEAGFKHGSIGLALPGQQVAIIDAQGNELPPGTEGDLAVRGRPPTLFAGYWESPEETKQAFRGDWYVTGDVAAVDADGFFWFRGRSEDLISGRGGTFAPYEVERALRAHAAVADSAVVGIRDLERGGHFVRAFVVTRPGAENSEQLEAEIRHFVGQTLPEEEVPREIEFVEDLPTAASGAIKRQSLRDRPVAGRPLWDLPPTSEPEPTQQLDPYAAASLAPEPVQFVQPEPEPELPEYVVPPAAAAPPPAAPPPPQAPPQPEVVEEPVAFVPEPVEPEPLDIPQYVVDLAEDAPAPLVEPAPAAPEPEPAVEPEPVEAPEAFVDVEPEPVVEPEAFVEPEPEPAPAEPGPEPVAEALPAQPAPEPEPDVLPEYVVEPSTDPEPVALAPEPEPLPATSDVLPDFVVDPATAPEPVSLVPDPEPEEEVELGPLPEFVVDPETSPVEPVALVPPPPPEPAPEPQAGALPDYVVDPEHAGAGGSSDGSDGSTPFAELGIRPATFPVPEQRDDGDEEDDEETPRRRRLRPAPEQPKSRRSRSAEPGDESTEVGWMQGLSNRLSAYSLAADEAGGEAAPDAGVEPDESDAEDDV